MNPSQILLLSIFLFSSIIHITSADGIYCMKNRAEKWCQFQTTCLRDDKGNEKCGWLPACSSDPKPKCRDVAFYEECCCDEKNCNKETKQGGERGTLTCRSGDLIIKAPGAADAAKEISNALGANDPTAIVKDEKECKACGMEKTKDKFILTCFKRNVCVKGEANDYPKYESCNGDSTKCCCEKNKCANAPKQVPAPPKPQPDKPQPKPDPNDGKPMKPGDDDEDDDDDDDDDDKGAGGMFPGIGVLALALTLSLGGILALHEESLQ